MATEPSTGECVCLYMPTVNTETITAFLRELAEQYPKDRIGIVLDGHAAHRSKRLQIPSQIVLLPIPTYSPEVNPAERVFKELRARLSNIVFDSLADLEADLTSALSIWWKTPALLQRLTSYSWWSKATHNIKTSFS
jgi:transposase